MLDDERLVSLDRVAAYLDQPMRAVRNAMLRAGFSVQRINRTRFSASRDDVESWLQLGQRSAELTDRQADYIRSQAL